mmetsp:Transcript_10784/g.9505  ORF Transcript_10784/g.9505 Transcript_10784/m.9505 type:complete len:137 (+) Transcript_10784:219-629(+)
MQKNSRRVYETIESLSPTLRRKYYNKSNSDFSSESPVTNKVDRGNRSFERAFDNRIRNINLNTRRVTHVSKKMNILDYNDAHIVLPKFTVKNQNKKYLKDITSIRHKSRLKRLEEADQTSINFPTASVFNKGIKSY